MTLDLRIIISRLFSPALSCLQMDAGLRSVKAPENRIGKVNWCCNVSLCDVLMQGSGVFV